MDNYIFRVYNKQGYQDFLGDYIRIFDKILYIFEDENDKTAYMSIKNWLQVQKTENRYKDEEED